MKPIITGDPQTFAIESCITRAYESPAFRALGYFVIQLGGRSYGVRSPEATMLACSFDEIGTRIARRSSHTAPFSKEPDAIAIASAINDSIYGPDEKEGKPLGFSAPQLKDLIYTHRLLWAPDGDEAFDDGSRIIHLDVDRRVRLIGFLLEDQCR